MRRITRFTGSMVRFSPRKLCVFIASLMLIQLQGCASPDLELWHTEKLTEEFTVEKANAVRTLDDYRSLEDRLFTQLEEKVIAAIGTGPEYRLFRYSRGSAADPERRLPNWNRTFELPADPPAGGVLLLHGMSDSPYSLRAIGQAFHQRNYWVVGLRLPGHGTAPSGLRGVNWEDMAAAVRLAAHHLAGRVGGRPIHFVGYSTGAPLALNFTLNALTENTSPLPASLVLISPAIGLHPAAALAGMKDKLSLVPGLGHFAWLTIEPEFDPFKFNSFATNAGNQVHRLTRSVRRSLAAWVRSGQLSRFPPTLVLNSTVDATVSINAVVDHLLKLLGPHGHELVLFDINRNADGVGLLISDPAPFTTRLMAETKLPFTVTLITNQHPESLRAVAHRKAPFSTAATDIQPLNLYWPEEVISLSHVALPFPPDDPLYGILPPSGEDLIFLGQLAIRGERGLFKLSPDWLLRLRYNPFYDFLESRTLKWVENAG